MNVPSFFLQVPHLCAMPPRRLRVLHLASWYPSDAHGTLGNFVQRHVAAIAGVADVEVWHVAKGRDRVVCRERQGVVERIAYVPGRWPWFIEVTRALLRFAREAERPDIVHVHVLFPAGIAGRLLARRWRVPLVATEHWTVYHPDQRTKLTWWRRAAIRWAGNGVDCLCPVTEQLGASMADFGVVAPVRVVPNVVDTDLFAMGASEAFPPRLLHISSLVDEQKNVTGLIEAVGKALDDLPPGTTLEVVGDGDPAPHAATVARLGLSGRVSTGGEISLSEVAERMARASAVLLFSRYENFPCVIPEAWSTGTPVIATDVGGIREHLPAWGTDDLGPFRGYCVPSEDQTAFAQALASALAAPVDQGAIRRYAEQHFSVDAVGHAYLAVYRSCLDRG